MGEKLPHATRASGVRPGSARRVRSRPVGNRYVSAVIWLSRQWGGQLRCLMLAYGTWMAGNPVWQLRMAGMRRPSD